MKKNATSLKKSPSKTSNKSSNKLDSKKNTSTSKKKTNEKEKKIENDTNFYKGDNHLEHIKTETKKKQPENKIFKKKENLITKNQTEKLPKINNKNINNKNINNEQKIDKNQTKNEYLSEKLYSNFSPSLLTEINNGISNTMETIKNSLEKNNLSISNNQKNLSNFSTSSNVSFNDEITFHLLNKLKNQQNNLQNEYENIINKEKNLLDEIPLYETEPNLKVDFNIKKNKLKEIKEKKEEIENKIVEIEFNIHKIIDSQKINNNNEKMKEFIKNYHKDKNKANRRIKELNEIKKIRQLKMEEDLKKSIEKKAKKLEMEENRILTEKKNLIDDIINTKKEKLNERRAKNIEIFKNSKSHINDKIPDKYKERYIYFHIKKLFPLDKKELELLKTDQIRRSNYFKPITLEELSIHKKNFEQNLEKNQENREKEYEKLKEQWKNTKEKLPDYKFPGIEKILEDESYKKKIEDKKILLDNKQKYSFKQEEKFKSKNFIKNNENETKIENNNNNNNNIVKNRMKDYQKILEFLKDPNNKNKIKYNWELKLKDDFNEKYNEELNKALNKKPIKIKLSSSYDLKNIQNFKNNNIKEFKDYLKEERERKEKNHIINNEIINFKLIKKVNSMDNNNNTRNIQKANIYYDIQNYELKANQFEELARQNEELIKLTGGVEKNPELNDKVSNLMLNSLKAKLAILESIEENNKNNNNNNNNENNINNNYNN